MTTDTIISKVWSFCTTLRDDGIGYGDYLEQLTYLIFLKMADEYGRPPYKRDVGVPKKYAWATLRPLKGAELEVHYVETLRALGTEKGMLGQIFTKAQNKITDPAKLARLIEMVGATEWVILDSDVKGDIYEGILEKNAEDTKSGAGQYFTPRAVIAAMVECVAPEPNKTIGDPACGTAGFFLAVYDYLIKNHKFDRNQKAFLKNGTFHGNEIVAGTRRLCLMNLFLQHIRSMLKTIGRAAVVLPDNVLFEGGAGEIVRKKLLETTELHTILRLPTGIFYAQGVKANVLFFDNRPASKTAATKEVWYYDYRTNIHHTLKRKPLREFINCYNPANRHKRKATWHPEKNPEGRWRKFTYDELVSRDKTSLDLFWLKDDGLADLDNLPEPADLAEEIIENIEAGLLNFRAVAAALQPSVET